MNAAQALKSLSSRLQKLSGEGRKEAELVLMHRLKATRVDLLLHKERLLTEEDEAFLSEYCVRREAGEPPQYIFGVAPFMGLEIIVTPDVLIPRQDTELLCEAVIALLPDKGRLLDMCTGSGCIAAAVCARRRDADVYASDISARALDVARRNAPRARLVQGDLFDAVPGEVFDVIACNPPYIRADERASLQREVRAEPELALFAGGDGLAFYRRIAKDAPGHLAPCGALALEIGIGQALHVSCLLEEEGFLSRRVLRDVSGTERVIIARIRSNV